jgi:hypothetical protein
MIELAIISHFNPTICIVSFFRGLWARRIDLDQARHDDRILVLQKADVTTMPGMSVLADVTQPWGNVAKKRTRK